jgi:hypothetical protein
MASERDALLGHDARQGGAASVIFCGEAAALIVVRRRSLKRHAQGGGAGGLGDGEPPGLCARGAWGARVACAGSSLPRPCQIPIRVPRASWSAVGGEGAGLVRVRNLARRSREAFNERDATHTALLERLWSAGGLRGPFQRHAPQWKELGFQGTDPATDLRGCGMLALHDLVHLFERERGVGAAWLERHLLCAATAINVTAMVLVQLNVLESISPAPGAGGLMDPSTLPGAAPTALSRAESRAVQLDAMGALLHLLQAARDEERAQEAFSQLVAAGMQLVLWGWDQHCRTEHARVPSPMELRPVLYSARVRLVHLLAMQPDSLEQLASWMRALEGDVLVSVDAGIA